MCIDFRKLNELQPEVCCADSETGGNISLVPLPKIDEMYGRLRGAKVFSTLDLRSGYYHISSSESSKAKTAFVTSFGKYQFEAVPFGLVQAPAYFQQLISMVLQECSDFAMAYLDDIIIFSHNEEKHLKHIEINFQKLKAAGLKLKESKCDFFKREIHYLGHLISDEGIHPLPEKLDTMHNMPKPRNPKEIKQFLGLCDNYRKFVPLFLDISRPLAKLTGHAVEWMWCDKCDLSFQMMKDFLISAPILKYPDTSKPYTIFTDASKYGWAGVLTQEHKSVVDGKEVTTNHPVSFVSGMFCGSQLNWAAMTKEVYATYMTVKKSTFYLTGQEITLRSDHLPLKKFLNHETLNNTVDNWAVEIESFKIKFIHIGGKGNVLADTLSRLIDIDPDAVLEPELKDYEFGHYAFETLPKAKSKSVGEKLALVDGVDICEINITYDNSKNSQFSVKLPLSNEQFTSLQENDGKIHALKEKVMDGLYSDFYFIHKGILYGPSLTMVTNSEQQYYWKGMRKHVLVHCKNCVTCVKQKV